MKPRIIGETINPSNSPNFIHQILIEFRLFGMKRPKNKNTTDKVSNKKTTSPTKAQKYENNNKKIAEKNRPKVLFEDFFKTMIDNQYFNLYYIQGLPEKLNLFKSLLI